MTPRCPPRIITEPDNQPIVVSTPDVSRIVQESGYTPPAPTFVTHVTLGPGSFPTYCPFRLMDGRAIAVSASDEEMPVVDGITLESGSEGQYINAAMIQSLEYRTNLQVLGDVGDILFIPRIRGAVTNALPTLLGGFTWSLPVGRKTGDKALVFSPVMPIKL
jgi:hypothetical protein